jgi:hypothetical protein
MSFKFYVATNELLRNLTKLLKDVEDYPKTKLGAPRIAIQYENNEQFQKILRKNLITNLHNLGGGFASGNSIVEQELQVNPGSGSGKRGVAAYQAGFKNTVRGTKAFKIATIWDQGGTIFPRQAKYLTQPLSAGKRIDLSPLEYKDSEHTAQLYKGKGTPARHPLIQQSVYGLMVIRKRVTKSLVRNKKGQGRKLGDHVATFLVLNYQKHLSSQWIYHAALKTRMEVLPIMYETGLKYIKSQKVLS